MFIKITNIVLIAVFLVFLVFLSQTVYRMTYKPPIGNHEESVQNHIDNSIKTGSSGVLFGNHNQFIYKKNTIDNSRASVATLGDYIYRLESIGNNKSIVKVSLHDESNRVMILTGYNIHSINAVNEKLVFAISTKNTDDIICEKIACINTDGSNMIIFDATENYEIESVIFNGSYIYYTPKNDNKILKIDLEGNLSLVYENSEGGTPHIFGLNTSDLFFVDGIHMYSLNIQNEKAKILSKTYSSKFQLPMLIGDSIVAFNGIDNYELSIFSLDGSNPKTIIDLSQFDWFNPNNFSINYTGGYYFVNSDGLIYYFNHKGNIKELPDVKAGSTTIYTTHSSLILEEKHLGSPIIVPVDWIVSHVD